MFSLFRNFGLAVLLALVAIGSVAAATPRAAAVQGDASACKACHEAAATTAFNKSRHAGLTDSCLSCHAGAAEHAKKQAAGDTSGPPPSVKEMTAQAIDATCLKCHEKGEQANWVGGTHDRRNVACTSCHSVHAYKSATAQLKTASASDTCYTCHKSERAKSMRTSHHPIREGKMGCTSCHNPHDGSQPKMIKADSINDLCYTCHTEKRGPFLFEHAPVREDCVSCHEPHGSNHKRLLLNKLPTLCQNCHFQGGGHYQNAGDNWSTEKGGVYTVAPTGAPSGFPVISSRWVEKSCRNCHVALHGSNSPSGAFFIR
jgi:DmsE family decaheme c-type cytochrome